MKYAVAHSLHECRFKQTCRIAHDYQHAAAKGYTGVREDSAGVISRPATRISTKLRELRATICRWVENLTRGYHEYGAAGCFPPGLQTRTPGDPLPQWTSGADKGGFSGPMALGRPDVTAEHGGCARHGGSTSPLTSNATFETTLIVTTLPQTFVCNHERVGSQPDFRSCPILIRPLPRLPSIGAHEHRGRTQFSSPRGADSQLLLAGCAFDL